MKPNTKKPLPNVFIEQKIEENQIDWHRWLMVSENKVICVGGWVRFREQAVSDYKAFKELLEHSAFSEIIPGNFNPEIVGGLE